MERAIFAGGCFWCMVQPFEEQEGILSVRSGYTGGHVPNPTDAFGQFEDRGDNYRPVIYYFDERQKKIAEQSKANLQASGRFDRPIVTKIEPAETFYEAEAYHQGFYKTNPERYAQSSTIRHQFLEENWK